MKRLSSTHRASSLFLLFPELSLPPLECTLIGMVAPCHGVATLLVTHAPSTDSDVFPCAHTQELFIAAHDL